MNVFDLPKPHALRATWVPLHFFPMLGSNDCVTVAVVAIDDHGNFRIVKSDGLHKLKCFFGDSGADHVRFIDMAVECVREEVSKHGSEIFDRPISLGSSFMFGTPTMGSGFSLDDIAASWLGKVSILQFAPMLTSEFLENTIELAGVVTRPASPREKKIVPAVRDEIAIIAPRYTPNFNREFTFKDRKVPVKLNYNGERLVAGFDRVSSKNIGGSLEKVRSKLWVLAEHRDQTLHESPKLHEMLVVPSTMQDAIVDTQEIQIVKEACSDIEQEADRREIRLRLFPSPRDLAAHIFRVETGQTPLQLQ